MSYQCCVAGNEQSGGAKALRNQSFLAEITLSPHYNHCFALYCLWTDHLFTVTQQGRGQIHQGVL